MWLAALFVAVALAGPVAAHAADLDAQLQEIRTLVREKRYPFALESLRLIARQIQELRADEVLPAFPAPPAGWTASPPLGILADDEIWSSRVVAGRTYLREGGGSRIDMTLDLRSPYAPAATMSFNPLFVAGDPQARLVDVGKERGLLRFNPDTAEGELRILIGSDTLVTLTGRGLASPEVLLDQARRVDFALLRARSGF